MSRAGQIDNPFYVRRRGRILLPPAEGEGLLPPQVIATMLKNIEALGYGFSPELTEACRRLSLPQLVALYEELVPFLKVTRGAHRDFAPMYPNFPDQVMAMHEGELYLNALVHYWSNGKLFPVTERKERFPLLDNVELTEIGLGTTEEYNQIFGQIVGANTAFGEQDRIDVRWFVEHYGDDIAPLLPEVIPQKENVAFVASQLLEHTSRATAIERISGYTKTATDTLRLAVALSGGDVSLATSTKFRTFSRPERTLLLALLDRLPFAALTEDMLRWKKRWIRLGEKLHPGEYQKQFPNALRAFAVLRNDEPFTTHNSGVEKAIADKNITDALARLSSRPGELARRLDHLLRLSATFPEAVIAAFVGVAPRISTPVLLQVRQHFAVRNDNLPLRVFFPKGNVGKAQSIPNTLPPLSPAVCAVVVAACESSLVARFARLPPLGKVYLDPTLADYTMPFALRSASRTLRTLVRGTRLPLPPDCTVLRFFLWWKNAIVNGSELRTDIDLSAVLYDAHFNYKNVLSYYNLKGFGGVHSGDIVDAPEGASEFIDVTLEKVRKAGIRYVIMVLNSFTQQPYVDLPECFAGWMARQKPGSGEIYEPRTVQDRLDLTADTRIAVPLVIDVVENRVIWCDIALRGNPLWNNNVAANKSGIAATLQSLVTMRKPNLYDLFALHIRARGDAVASPTEADTVFSVASGTPFRLEEIASGYMA